MNFFRKSSAISLTILLLLQISGCSTNPVFVQKEVVISIPSSLLVDPCEPVSAGDTVRSLAKAYVKNTSCVGEYIILLRKQREYTERVGELYNVKQ